MAAAWKSVDALSLYEVRFLSADGHAFRQVWAPDREAAAALVRDRASLFGLREDLLVTEVVELEIREEGLDAAA